MFIYLSIYKLSMRGFVNVSEIVPNGAIIVRLSRRQFNKTLWKVVNIEQLVLDAYSGKQLSEAVTDA
jgi:hypothetical protein